MVLILFFCYLVFWFFFKFICITNKVRKRKSMNITAMKCVPIVPSREGKPY